MWVGAGCCEPNIGPLQEHQMLSHPASLRTYTIYATALIMNVGNVFNYFI